MPYIKFVKRIVPVYPLYYFNYVLFRVVDGDGQPRAVFFYCTRRAEKRVKIRAFNIIFDVCGRYIVSVAQVVNRRRFTLLYARMEDGAIWLDNTLPVTVALDDGSVYSFNTDDYRPGESGVRWELDEQAAAEALPKDFAWDAVRRVILTSEGGRDSGCFEFSGPASAGRRVRVYVDAADGKQARITLDPAIDVK